MISSIDNYKPLYDLYNSLAPQTMSVEPEPQFQASAPNIQNTWALTSQPWLES